MNKEYIEALADALITKGRRYGLSSTYKKHLIEILSSVPTPVEKSECCRGDLSPEQLAAAEETRCRIVDELRKTAAPVAGAAISGGQFPAKDSENGKQLGCETKEEVRLTQLINAVHAVPDVTIVARDGDGVSIVASVDSPGAPKDGEKSYPLVSLEVPNSEFATVLPKVDDTWTNTGGLPDGAPDNYKATSTPAKGFSITGRAHGKGTK
jgi:hypothetical protein